MATTDDRPRISIDSDNVSIDVVNARTARLAQQFIDDATDAYLDEDDSEDERVDLAGELVATAFAEPVTDDVDDADDEPDVDTEPEDTTDDTDTEPETESGTEQDADEITLTATSGAPWEDYDDRDARVEAYVDARFDYEGGPFETTAGQIAEVLDENGMGVSYALKDLDAYDAEKTGQKEAGANVWRITEADDEADEQDDDEEVTAEDMPDLHGEQIEIDSRSGGTVAVDAVDVIDAIADSPTIYYLHGDLGTDKDAAEGLLHTLDLYDHFQDEAPLERSLVRETVAEYLGVEA